MPIYYTSNVALVDHGQVGAAITAPVVGLTYAPRFPRTRSSVTSRFGSSFYYSNDLSSFNFASFDAIAGLAYYARSCTIWRCARTSILIDSRARDDFDSFFSNLGLVLNAEVPIPIGRAQQISLGTLCQHQPLR